MTGENILSNKYAEFIRGCVLFNSLDERSRNLFLSLFHVEKWPKNTCILNKEKFSFHFFVIISGRVKMYQVDNFGQKEITLFILSTNDIFDFFCFLDGKEHDVFYECLDEVNVLVAPMTEVRKWYSQYPAAFQNLLPYAGQQLRNLESFLSSVTFTDISTRILRLLINNSSTSAGELKNINGLSNKEIAHLIGSTRTVVNRHLQKLKENGSIKIYRNRLEINDLSKLIKLLESQQKKL